MREKLIFFIILCILFKEKTIKSQVVFQDRARILLSSTFVFPNTIVFKYFPLFKILFN